MSHSGPNSVPDSTVSPASTSRRLFYRYSLLAIIAAVCLARTLSVHNTFLQSADEAKQDAAFAHASFHSAQIKDEFDRYATTLPLMRGYAQATPNIDREGWNRFITGSNLIDDFPAVFGFAYVSKVDPTDLDQFVASRRDEGMTDFRVHLHNNAEPTKTSYDSPLYIVTYEEPEERNRAALGLDVSAIPANKAVYDHASETAQVELSNPFTLKQLEQNSDSQSSPVLGIVMSLAVYDQSLPLDTVEQRSAATTGWVAVVLDFNHFLNQTWHTDSDSARVVMTAGHDKNNAVTVFDSAIHAPPIVNNQSNLSEFTFAHTIAGRTFTHQITLDPLDPISGPGASAIEIYHQRKARANASLFIGLVVTSLVTALAWIITAGRARAVKIAEQMTKSLRESEAEQRKLAHKAQQASNAKTEFLTNMSHELRTPMTAILGYSDILAEMIPLHRDPESMRDNVHRIKTSGENLLSIIDNILDLSIIEGGKSEINEGPCLVSGVLSEVLSGLTPQADRKGISLTTRFDTPIPATILADGFRVRQILANLAFNAIKFTNHGSVTIVVSASDDPVEPTICFAIKDTGIGIEESKLDQLFNRFEQSDSSLTRKYGGIGLGLTISKHLAELMNGKLEAKSVVSEGSTFTLTIPAKDPPGQTHRGTLTHLVTPQPTNDVRQSDPRTMRRAADYQPIVGRVLVAEDGEDNQRLIRHFLGKAGLNVEIVENGQLAIERITEDPNFDIVVMDMQMPILDGYAATRELRKLGFTLPILALTAHALAGDKERCLEAGCSEYLTKPINRTRFLKIVQRLIEVSRASDRSAA